MTIGTFWPNALSGWLQVIESVMTVCAIIIAGVWAYMLFVRRRQKYPRAEVSHRIVFDAQTDDGYYLRGQIRIKNIGDVLLSIASGFIRVQEIMPHDAYHYESGENDHETEFEWPLLKEIPFCWNDDPREIEPGECDEIDFDVLVATTSENILVYSYVENRRKRRRRLKRRTIGWNTTSFHRFQGKQKMSQSTSEGTPRPKDPPKRPTPRPQGPPKRRPRRRPNPRPPKNS